MSEFFGSARQSRIAMKFTGKIASMAMTGYYEADWLSSGTTSNNNQSNSYTMRQRELWADAKTTSGWDFSGGTGWSLVAETASGSYPRNPNPAVHHRRAVRCGLRLGAPGKLPRSQEHGHEGLVRHVG